MKDEVTNSNQLYGSYSAENHEVPDEFRRDNRWLAWKPDERGKKVPRAGYHQPDFPGQKVSAHEPENWGTYYRVLAWVEKHPEYGIGFDITESDPYALLDFDDVRDPETGQLHSTVAQLIDTAGTWGNISVSGTGIHLLCIGELPPGERTVRTDLPSNPEFPEAKIEIYDSRQFVAMSGVKIDGTPDRIADCQSIIDEFAPEPRSQAANSSSLGEIDIDRRMAAFRNSANADRNLALWEGRYREAGYDNRSDAESALAAILGFYLGKRKAAVRQQIDKACQQCPQTDFGPRKWTENPETYRTAILKSVNLPENEYQPPKGRRPYSLLPPWSDLTWRQTYHAILRKGYGTESEIAAETDRSPRQIRRVLSAMVDENMINWVRDGRSTYYFILESELPENFRKRI